MDIEYQKTAHPASAGKGAAEVKAPGEGIMKYEFRIKKGDQLPALIHKAQVGGQDVSLFA